MNYGNETNQYVWMKLAYFVQQLEAILLEQHINQQLHAIFAGIQNAYLAVLI